ncbi:MAG: hypothetical protein JKY81_00700 [Colwellia sp.]|nr:hypothetical protein [Colwellia sp.]
MNLPNRQQASTFFKASLLLMFFSVSTYGYEQKHIAKDAAQLVKIKANPEHDFLLFADYYVGGKRSGGVIVLHDCNRDRRAYSATAKSLAEQGLHTLLVDLRGYGESISSAYSQEIAKKKSKDIISYQSEMALITAHWPSDLLASYQFLAKKVAKNKDIAIVASGCSSAYAVALAEKIQFNSMVLITPKMTYGAKERYKNLVDIPSYFITSLHHQDSYQTAQELFVWSGAKQSKIQVFKGDRYNSQLISRQKHLVNDIALWVKHNLR